MLTEEEHEKRMRLYQQGWNDRQISEALFLDTKTICKWRKKHDLPSNFNVGREQKIDRHVIRRLLEQGLTCKGIAELLGCSVATIYNIRKALHGQNNNTSIPK